MKRESVENVVGTYAQFTRDFRAIFRKVKEPDIYYTVTTKINGEITAILRLSHYDADIDGEVQGIDVTSGNLANNTAFYLNAVRFLLIPLHLRVNGKPKYVIEAGPFTPRWVRRLLGFSTPNDYRKAILDNFLGEWLTRSVADSKTEAEEQLSKALEVTKSFKKEVLQLGRRNSRIEAERNRLEEDLQRATRTGDAAQKELSQQLGVVGAKSDALRDARLKCAQLERTVEDLKRDKKHLRSLLDQNNIEVTKPPSVVI